MRKRRIGTAKFFTLLLLLYHTSAKSQGMKQLMAGGGVALIGITLVPLLELERLQGFVNHPFKVQADSQMIELQESIWN